MSLLQNELRKDIPQKEFYTCEDLLSWDEDVRAEIIDGELFMMAQPTFRHQGVLMELSRQLANFLDGKPCKVYPAPTGVRLFAEKETLLEPDIVVICDHSKQDDRIYHGAPDMVVEILSPSTARRDRVLKLNLYQQAGVREYWIVDTEAECLHVYVLQDEQYQFTQYDDTTAVPVHILPGCEINLNKVFG